MRRVCYLLTFCLIILTLLTYSDGVIIGDMAEYLNNAFRILQGQLPYRDFWLLFPPGEVHFPAIIFRIFGIDINYVLLANTLVGFLSAWVGFKIVRIFTKIFLYAYVSGLLIFFFAVHNVYVLFVLLAAYFLIKAKYFLVGLFLGISFWFRIYEIAAIFSAFVLFLLLDRKFKDIKKLLVGMALPVILMLVAFRDILPLMLNQLLYESLRHGTIWRLPYFIDLKMNLLSLKGNLRAVLHMPYLLGIYLLPVTVISSAWSLEKRNKYIYLFLVWILALAPRALMRGSLETVAHSLLPSILLAGILIAQPVAKYLRAGLYLSILLSLWIVVVFLAESFRTLIKQRNILDTQRLVDLVNSKTKPGDKIFVTGWESPPLYVLTLRNNPTYYDSLIDLLAVPSIDKEIELCHQLLVDPPKLIIHDFKGGITDVDRKFYSFEKLTPYLNHCIRENFGNITVDPEGLPLR